MASLAPSLATTTFVRWTMQGSDGKPAWGDAFDRMNART